METGSVQLAAKAEWVDLKALEKGVLGKLPIEKEELGEALTPSPQCYVVLVSLTGH